MKYVIKHHVNITTRTGKKIEHDSYFEAAHGGAYFYVMDPEKAMQFDSREEAKRIRRKYFGLIPGPEIVSI